MTANPAMDPRTYVPRDEVAQSLARLREVIADPEAARSTPATLTIADRSVEVTPVVLDALRLLVGALADGRPVTVSPQAHMVTPHEAAEFLHLTRAQLDQLMESGRLPFQTIGLHHRILLQDVLAHHRRTHGDRAGLDAAAED